MRVDGAAGGGPENLQKEIAPVHLALDVSAQIRPQRGADYSDLFVFLCVCTPTCTPVSMAASVCERALCQSNCSGKNLEGSSQAGGRGDFGEVRTRAVVSTPLLCFTSAGHLKE